jgi:glycosyltransferase involved in cell wall biosynthesis
LLTLAIPNFNGAKYLPATLESLRRNRPHVRWWLQDGASSDDSLTIAQACRTGSDVVVSEPDAGQTDALNRAIRQMGGDVIGFINSDDLLADGAASAVTAYFDAHPDIDLAYGQVRWIDAAGNFTGEHAGSIGSLAEILDLHRIWWGHRQWVQPEVFFRRSLWDRVGPFDSRYQLAFDYDFWVRCLKAGARVARLPVTLAHFRLHPDQKSRAAEQAAREIREIAKRHLEDAAIPALLRQRLLREIDYDQYHRSEPPYDAGKPSFIRYLFNHPSTLLAPAVRRRVVASLIRQNRKKAP